MLSDTSMPAAVPLLELSGPGDCGRTDWVDDLGSEGVPLRESSGAPHISQDSSEGWFEKVHRGQWNVATGSFSGPPETGVDVPGDEALLKDSDRGLLISGYEAFARGDEGIGELGA